MSLAKYPAVLSEDETLDLILSGRSIARYGDGELRIADHICNIKNQIADPKLTKRLAEILHDSGDCLVGVPNIEAVSERNPDRQKVEYWGRYYLWTPRLFSNRKYVSAFITRPDSAPWINTPDYWDRMATLWKGRDVCVVRGSGKSFSAADLVGARTVTEIIAPRGQQNGHEYLPGSWFDYDAIMERIISVKPKRVLLGLGPSATVMAVDLCARGIHALDLGHAAMFLRKFRKGEPTVVTEEDKAVDKVPA